MSLNIRDLPGEAIVVILEHLRATDLASAREVSKSIFCKSLISKAVLFQIENVYSKSWSSPSKEKRLPGYPFPQPKSTHIVEYGCDDLFITEIKSILFALSSPAPVNGRGYWISATWLANAKKFYESISLPDVRINGKRTTPKKLAKIRQRRGSDVLPPWPEMNADITCSHCNLALSKNLRAKKRLLAYNFWQFLRKFYPSGPEYISTKSSECILCQRDDEIAKASALSIRVAEIKSRRSEFLNGPLESLASRKSGVPTHLLTQKMIPVFESDWEALSFSSCPDSYSSSEIQELFSSSQPLLPGLYNLLPKAWLKSWRNYAKNPGVSSLPAMDCTKMLCHSHGLLIIPPHVEEYLVGLRRSLLSGLGLYQGEIVEIISADEWDSLQASLRSFSDFSVRFCLDGDSVSWNIGVCSFCCPLSHGPSR